MAHITEPLPSGTPLRAGQAMSGVLQFRKLEIMFKGPSEVPECFQRARQCCAKLLRVEGGSLPGVPDCTWTKITLELTGTGSIFHLGKILVWISGGLTPSLDYGCFPSQGTRKWNFNSEQSRFNTLAEFISLYVSSAHSHLLLFQLAPKT